MLTLVPMALAVTIPMSLLIGLLIGLGRFSGDREWVALQSCGVGISRVLRPVLGLRHVAGFATLYVMLWAVPDANQTSREITYRIVAQRAEGEVKPRVFFEDFPNQVLYVRDTPADGPGWLDVFLADTTSPGNPVIYLAERGRMLLDRERRTVELVLDNGTQHTLQADSPSDYNVGRFGAAEYEPRPGDGLSPTGPMKGDREMTIAELRTLIAELNARRSPPTTPRWRFRRSSRSLSPAWCLRCWARRSA